MNSEDEYDNPIYENEKIGFAGAKQP
ncbi:protein of unknown function [Kingella kingae]|nr:protein of unknown function [Kingella kingae]